jgi:hypothetical protein
MAFPMKVLERSEVAAEMKAASEVGTVALGGP